MAWFQVALKELASNPFSSFIHLATRHHFISKVTAVRCVSQATQLDEHFIPIDHSALKPKIQYPLAGEKYLPGSHGPGMPKYLNAPRPGIPQAYRVQNPDKYSIPEWSKLCRALIDERLSKYGTILFKGLPLYDGNLYSKFISHLGLTPQEYKGGTTERPTYDKDANTYISTLDDKRFIIEPHNEMTYAPIFPRKAFFYCSIPTGEGCNGLAPVTLSTEVLTKLDPNVVEKFKEKQVRYHNCRPNEGKRFLSWQRTLGTKDRKTPFGKTFESHASFSDTNYFWSPWYGYDQEVEEMMKAMNMEFEWWDDGTLFYWVTLPAIITHPITGEEVWFNQADSHHSSYYKAGPMFEGVKYESDFHYPAHSTYGDGSPIELDVLQHIREVKWQCSVGIQLKKTDLLVYDNIKAMHGRMSYTGERQILVFLSAD